MGLRPSKPLLVASFLLVIFLTDPHPASAWGDEGHKIIALIAWGQPLRYFSIYPAPPRRLLQPAVSIADAVRA
jgi:hypothetical protein